jgi:hypothetical protein
MRYIHAPYDDRLVDHECGSIFNKYTADKPSYQRAIDIHKRSESLMYCNDLHDLLLERQGCSFWRVWRSKIGISCGDIIHVDGISDDSVLADKFVKHFQQTCKPVDNDSCAWLCDEYNIWDEYI